MRGGYEVKSRFAVKLVEVKSSMRNRTISIPLDPQTAQAYGAARAEEKLKVQALVSLWLRELTARELQQVPESRLKVPEGHRNQVLQRMQRARDRSQNSTGAKITFVLQKSYFSLATPRVGC